MGESPPDKRINDPSSENVHEPDKPLGNCTGFTEVLSALTIQINNSNHDRIMTYGQKWGSLSIGLKALLPLDLCQHKAPWWRMPHRHDMCKQEIYELPWRFCGPLQFLPFSSQNASTAPLPSVNNKQSRSYSTLSLEIAPLLRLRTTATFFEAGTEDTAANRSKICGSRPSTWMYAKALAVVPFLTSVSYTALASCRNHVHI